MKPRKRGWFGSSWALAGALVALPCGATLGCASSDAATPSEVCERFVASYCDKAVSCARATDRSDFAELCEFSFRVYLPCEQVTDVWRDSQPCQDQLAAIRCADVEPGSFPATPADCTGLFGIQ